VVHELREIADEDWAPFEQRLERWLWAKIGKLLAGILLVVLGSAVAGALAWGSAMNRVTLVERDLARLDSDGSRPVRHLQAQIDSLRLQMQVMPSRVADELEVRLRRHRGTP
jgi:hypothetical protein